MLDEVLAPAPLENSHNSIAPVQATTTRSTCPYCGVGCGVLASANGADVIGDPAHPANFGRLCSKGSALGETLGLEGRLLHPMRRQSDGAFARVSWDAALDQAADGFRRIVDEHGPDAVAVYLSGQLLTEDYYVANKLMKGFIGSANVDTNSRLCMASTVAGHKRAFGADVVPGCYEDLDEADLIVLVGSNAAWCHPVLFQRIMRNKEERGAKLVVIDTRRTPTAESADLFLQIAPGADQALFCGLFVHLTKVGAFDDDFVRRHTAGLEGALKVARTLAPSIEATAASTGLREVDIASFFAWFAQTPRTVTCFSQGVNQSAQGTDKVNAIINCHLATGRVGKSGASPFSLTGQPNAMGGREVGGLANSLAAHMGFEPANIDRVGRFWNAPRMATRDGLKAVQMFDAIARGDIKALWVVGTNPAASLPNANAARAALSKLELFIVSDNVTSNDTINSGAHLLLPAQAWGEKSGTVTNSERRISRQRAFLPPPGETRADWAIFADVARRMGFAGFDYGAAADVFREHAALSAFENNGTRGFDIGGLARLSDAEYDALAPTQWPVPDDKNKGRARLFADGGFFCRGGRAKFIALATPTLATELTRDFPLRLNTGRIRDQWHTMTRSGMSPRLARHLPEPFVEINPSDAKDLGVEDGGFARVATPYGSCVLRAVVTDRQPAGHIFAPIHWTDETAADARIGALVAPCVDPFSGQPESKATPAIVTPMRFARQGFLLSRSPITLPQGVWWARVAVANGYGYRVAGDLADDEWTEIIHAAAASEDVIHLIDETKSLFSGAAFLEDRATLIWALSPLAQSWDFALELFARDRLDQSERLSLLSGRSGRQLADDGPLVCSCFSVGQKQIEAAIHQGCRSALDVGKATRAGSNCGSCQPEIQRLIKISLAAESAMDSARENPTSMKEGASDETVGF
ncbi:nitrate reductase [Methylocystis sp. H62]|uniref:nitrate reductase n=1 Tax=Methylocystis sp. H62 TaxID=2785789 RepID=UPI0018C23EC9|nr:nitrate reductase [Methylocystis sp. H62]MBG0794702.1 nitrate reductase [Methylocystis sp. H62]